MSLQWTAWLAAMTRKGRILYTLRIKGKSELKEGSVWATNIKLFHFFMIIVTPVPFNSRRVHK